MEKNVIQRVLIANRGEPCARIAKSLRKLNIASVAVFARGEDAAHARFCDESIALPQEGLAAYLQIEDIVQAAIAMKCDAIHPGWGFLSENASFAARVEQAGLVFIGPTAEQMRTLGDKNEAKARAKSLGIPVVPFVSEENLSAEKFLNEVEKLSFPLLLKPLAGGGGKGMLLVNTAEQLPSLVKKAKREAELAFGDGRLLAEVYLERPKHVEIQIIGDGQGKVWHLGERDCTIQRRHQKMIEESPCLSISAQKKEEIFGHAVSLVSSVGYRNVGTVEFIIDARGRAYFMEVNTRLQVEHGVTEELLGVDLVELQLMVAQGQPVDPAIPTYAPKHHVMQVRVYAEDPYVGFLPCTGTIRHLELPDEDCRVDHALEVGTVVDSTFDPMLMKVIVKAEDRSAAISLLKKKLSQTVLLGIQSNLNYFQWICDQPDFQQHRHDTQWVDRHLDAYQAWEGALDLFSVAHAAAAYLTPNRPSSVGEDTENDFSVWNQIKSWKLGGGW